MEAHKQMITNLPTYVLSLKSAIDRRKSIRERLDGVVSYQIFDALTPADLGELIGGRGRLTPGEYCCAMSHRAIAGLAVEHDVALVLEDDANLMDEFVPVVAELADRMRSGAEDADIVVIGYSKIPQSDRFRIGIFNPISRDCRLNSGAFTGRPFRQWPCGAVAYLISRQGAQRLRAATTSIDGAADDWAMFSSKGMLVRHCHPLVVLEDYRVLESAIEGERQNFSENNPLLDPVRYLRGWARRCGLLVRRWIEK